MRMEFVSVNQLHTVSLPLNRIYRISYIQAVYRSHKRQMMHQPYLTQPNICAQREHSVITVFSHGDKCNTKFVVGYN